MAEVRCALLLILLFFTVTRAQIPGFVSIDCGGTESYTDELGLVWTSDKQLKYGELASISVVNENRKQYTSVRYFPADNRKYCYTLSVTIRTRYLLRASFLYGNFDKSNVYPKFDISVGATYWSTIVVYNASSIITKELVFLASSPTVSLCLSNATTGQPFISTIELRPFNSSLYHTDAETQFFMSMSARINFGAEATESIRYPDDPFDRIWESDTLRANHLVDVAPGTEKISTTMPIDVNTNERPPIKVMQTAVVGQEGILHYRLNLNGFPGYGWAFIYFAEIEDFGTNETRRFKLVLPDHQDLTRPIIDIQENTQGKYKLYEPGSYNISLPFVFTFGFKKTNDSSRGPIINALEIYSYTKINFGSLDASIMENFTVHYPLEAWAQEGGDPCLPVPWSWVKCSSDPQPHIISITLSGKTMTGNIPSELTRLTGLVELWLDGNMLSGMVPDFGGCLNLTIVHLENNKLTGQLPLSFADLPGLKELYVQNNMLSGALPDIRKGTIFNYSGNIHLQKKSTLAKNIIIVMSCMIVSCILLLVLLVSVCLAYKKKKFIQKEDDLNKVELPQKLHSSLSELATETAQRYSLSEIEKATSNFARKVGSGGYGVVYHGKMADGKEIAVKVLMNDTIQGNRQFSNEVSLLSRIHHRNLVAFLGHCQQEGKNILIYEFMHNGTLKDHLHGTSSREKQLSWMNRLEIAEDAAKGVEYLHTGCSPTIIHSDLKTSNILLDQNMRAKVADFGLSKPAVDESHVSSVVRGTVGYLDPEYYTSQQLTAKSDVYSFGVILLELISGLEPILNITFGENFRHIGQWAKFNYENGDIEAILDPLLRSGYNDIQSVWKIAEVAVKCVNHEKRNRPCMAEVLKDIQDAISMERAPPSVKSIILYNSNLESPAKPLAQPDFR